MMYAPMNGRGVPQNRMPGQNGPPVQGQRPVYRAQPTRMMANPAWQRPMNRMPVRPNRPMGQGKPGILGKLLQNPTGSLNTIMTIMKLLG